MVHEHLSMNFHKAFVSPRDIDSKNADNPFSLDNVGWIRYNPYSHHSNLVFNDTDTSHAINEELMYFKKNGGGSIVECTTHGIERNAKFLLDMSTFTGINIIAGTGFYVASFQQELLYSWTEEQLAQEMHNDICEGCREAPNVRCGLIGEIGCSFSLQSMKLYSNAYLVCLFIKLYTRF